MTRMRNSETRTSYESETPAAKKYAQEHLARITSILAPTPRLPPEMVRKIAEFWLHAGFY